MEWQERAHAIFVLPSTAERREAKTSFRDATGRCLPEQRPHGQQQMTVIVTTSCHVCKAASDAMSCILECQERNVNKQTRDENDAAAVCNVEMEEVRKWREAIKGLGLRFFPFSTQHFNKSSSHNHGCIQTEQPPEGGFNIILKSDFGCQSECG